MNNLFIHYIAEPSIFSKNIENNPWSIEYEYNSNSRIPIPSETINRINIHSLNDFDINMDSISELYLDCDLLQTMIVIHSVTCFICNIFNKNGQLLQTFNSNNNNYIIDFGNQLGYIQIIKTCNISFHLKFSSIVFSNSVFNNYCNSYRYYSIGLYHQIIIVSENSDLYSQKDIDYQNNQKLCIWFSSPTPLNVQFDFLTDPGFDSIEVFTSKK